MGVRRAGTPLLLVMALAVLGVVAGRAAQRGDAGATVKFATPTPPAPLFFREDWRQPSPFDASTNFEPERPVTQAAVTNPDLELRLYDPHAKEIAGFVKTPPTDSRTRPSPTLR